MEGAQAEAAQFLEVDMLFPPVRLTQLRLVAEDPVLREVVQPTDQILLRLVKRQVVEEGPVLSTMQLLLEEAAAEPETFLPIVTVEVEQQVKVEVVETLHLLVLMLSPEEAVLGQQMEGLQSVHHSVHLAQPIINVMYKAAPVALVEQQFCEDQLSILVAAAVAEHFGDVFLLVKEGLEA